MTKFPAPAMRISMENSKSSPAANGPLISVDARLHIRLRGETHEVAVAANQTLLAAARDAGIEPPFTCQKGACGACMAKLVVGTVHQLGGSALEPEQKANDLILTCQSIATSDLIAVDYG